MIDKRKPKEAVVFQGYNDWLETVTNKLDEYAGGNTGTYWCCIPLPLKKDSPEAQLELNRKIIKRGTRFDIRDIEPINQYGFEYVYLQHDIDVTNGDYIGTAIGFAPNALLRALKDIKPSDKVIKDEIIFWENYIKSK